MLLHSAFVRASFNVRRYSLSSAGNSQGTKFLLGKGVGIIIWGSGQVKH